MRNIANAEVIESAALDLMCNEHSHFQIFLHDLRLSQQKSTEEGNSET